MKAVIYSPNGDKKEEIELPAVFNTAIREDIAIKHFEAEKFLLRQPYSHFSEAGKRHSASGTISHRRHKWKGAYGKGISRVPRKKMYRRGTNFFWVGAEVSSARGGRTINAPQGMYTPRKINKKEKSLALNSGIAATADPAFIKIRYSTIQSIPAVPIIIESFPNKTKDIILAIKKIFGNASEKILKVKQVRSGKGSKRARRYKSNAGALIVSGNNEKVKCSGIDIKNVSDIKMRDLYPLGRLVIYTRKAVEEMKNDS